MTTLIASTDLYNPAEYGRVAAGDTFTVRDSLARELVKAGKASMTYETKVVTPSFTVRTDVEVKPLPANPFRDVSDLDQESPALAAVRSAVRAASEVPEPGDSGGVERESGDGIDTGDGEVPAFARDALHRLSAKRRVRRSAR